MVYWWLKLAINRMKGWFLLMQSFIENLPAILSHYCYNKRQNYISRRNHPTYIHYTTYTLSICLIINLELSVLSLKVFSQDLKRISIWDLICQKKTHIHYVKKHNHVDFKGKHEYLFIFYDQETGIYTYY